jgi:hypothetical protein
MIINMLNSVNKSGKFTHYILFLGTGLYQLTFGLFAHLLVNFLMGISLIVFYPYITPFLLIDIEIIGWVLVSFGCFTSTFPYIQNWIKQRNFLSSILNFIIKISAVLTFFLIPFGIFLGISLFSEIKFYNSKTTNSSQKVNKKRFLHSIFTFICGLFHIILGLLINLILAPFFIEEIDFLFPYINYNIINILNILGWMSSISGLILTICSFWVNSLQLSMQNEHVSHFLRLILILIIMASGALIVIFPFGTYFGITMIIEFFPSKK